MNHSGMIALLSVMDRRICATSSDGHIVWNKKLSIDGKRVKPKGLIYLPDQDLLLVGDYNNRRIIVITGRMG